MSESRSREREAIQNQLHAAVRKIGRGLWVLDLLRLYANPETGLVSDGNIITDKELGEWLGCPESAIRRWVEALESFGLVRTVPCEDGRVFSIRPGWMLEESAAYRPQVVPFPGTGGVTA